MANAKLKAWMALALTNNAVCLSVDIDRRLGMMTVDVYHDKIFPELQPRRKAGVMSCHVLTSLSSVSISVHFLLVLSDACSVAGSLIYF